MRFETGGVVGVLLLNVRKQRDFYRLFARKMLGEGFLQFLLENTGNEVRVVQFWDSLEDPGDATFWLC